MGRIGGTELLIVVIPFLAIYFLPSFIALSRKKTNRSAIILLNFFLGWTFVGWIVSLVWACTSDKELQSIIVNNSNYSKEESMPALQKNDFDEKLDKLQKLKDLLDSGILSQEEFDQQKSKVLSL